MPQRHSYFDRRGRELSRTEALHNGVLKDGVSLRVHMSARDSARSFWDAHRDSLLVADARRIGGTEGLKPGFRVFNNDLGRADREAAYREHEAFLRDSWRNPPPDAAFASFDRKIKKYNARGQEEGYFEETEEGDAASVGDAKKKKEDPPVTGRSRCPECDGSGVVHGKTCQGCGDDGWVDDEENGDDEDDGETTADARTVDQIAHDHVAAMERLYAARNREISEAWREGKATNG